MGPNSARRYAVNPYRRPPLGIRSLRRLRQPTGSLRSRWRSGYQLFRHHARRHWSRGRRRHHEGEPNVPAVWAMLVGEFPIGLQVEVALNVLVDGKDVADLRTD